MRRPRPTTTEIDRTRAPRARVVITRSGVPLVRLVPITPRGKRCFGALKGKIAIDGRFDEPLPEIERWELATNPPFRTRGD